MWGDLFLASLVGSFAGLALVWLGTRWAWRLHHRHIDRLWAAAVERQVPSYPRRGDDA